MIAFYLMVIFKTRKDASLFTSSVVSGYIAYLGWAAMASIPNDTCNPFLDSTANTYSQIFVGMFITFVVFGQPSELTILRTVFYALFFVVLGLCQLGIGIMIAARKFSKSWPGGQNV